MLDTKAPHLASPRGFADGYAPLPTKFDEMIDSEGALRPHWSMFVNMLDDLGQGELKNRVEQARRLIHENGITHNVYGDPQGLDRPWSLDFIPLLLPAAHWRTIEAALIQRAKLLDLLLTDIYGPTRCIVEGLLPAELLYANPGYLRPCHGIPPLRGRSLHLYAADVARSHSGQMMVLSDRTQAPSGSGYTLENRIVLSRVLPTVFRQCQVERLAPYFVTLRQTLSDLAPSNKENPRIVLLTPGPYSETFFEHAYLARYLGYALVQGNDLTVRDTRVYLKTLGGLQRVDVILRRVDDSYCDPLELLARSYLGVPGLLEAIRAGTVAVVNTLGSGVLQAPGFLPFLPGLCRFFLKEELSIPSVPTWWCGEPAGLRYVLEHLDELVIKPAMPAVASDPIFGRDLSKDELKSLGNRISAKPIEYVGQELVVSGTVPALIGDKTQYRQSILRSYLVANSDSFEVMAGGLTRITNSNDAKSVSLQKGGGSKDTWILADGPVSEVTLLPSATQPLDLNRGGGDLPSRVADDFFWLGRYVQRAESTVRLARGVLCRLMDPGRQENSGVLQILFAALMGKSPIRSIERSEQQWIEDIFAPVRPEGLRATVSHVHGMAKVLRDRISGDAWRILQTLENDVSIFDAGHENYSSVLELLDRLVVSFAAFMGLAMDSMTRGQSWRFLDMGHRIERALALSQLIQSTLISVTPHDSYLLDAVLEIADSSLTYRRRYFSHVEAPAVIDLLVADETNPRAVAFQVNAIQEHLTMLPREPAHPQDSPDRQTALRLHTVLQLADLHEACAPIGGKRTKLDELLTETIDELTAIAESLGHIYFSHATSGRRFISSGQELPS